MTEVCIVPAHVLKGVLKAASDCDVRTYLNGILFDVPRGRLVATDGHCMMLVKQTFAEGAGNPFIVPRDTLETAVKLVTKSAPNLGVSVTQEGSALRHIQLCGAKGFATGTEIDGRYPDYTGVIPAKLNGKAADFNPQLVARVHAGMALVVDQNRDVPLPVTLVTNGDKAAVMACGNPDVLCVVMPWRGGDSAMVEAALVAFGFAKPAAKAAA